ncbi:hypothetical protein BS47DRAFT_1354704 [Hydnum rufescens UP504]|uniref:Uncharacterized protein n=1 Tax=Hydnum rufescens UP504 TaxID=1448309 RepID=A0A9P6AH39_9AGAM|nr:hypothetical protein BS47DRAFT_1354704 [Hydnum rufescens UP504]
MDEDGGNGCIHTTCVLEYITPALSRRPFNFLPSSADDYWRRTLLSCGSHVMKLDGTIDVHTTKFGYQVATFQSQSQIDHSCVEIGTRGSHPNRTARYPLIRGRVRLSG